MPNGNGVRCGSVEPRYASTEPNGFAFICRLGPTGRPLKNRWAPLGNLVKADDPQCVTRQPACPDRWALGAPVAQPRRRGGGRRSSPIPSPTRLPPLPLATTGFPPSPAAPLRLSAGRRQPLPPLQRPPPAAAALPPAPPLDAATPPPASACRYRPSLGPFRPLLPHPRPPISATTRPPVPDSRCFIFPYSRRDFFLLRLVPLRPWRSPDVTHREEDRHPPLPFAPIVASLDCRLPL